MGEIWLQGSIILFAASLIQSLTGFGFGLVAVPLLLFVLPSQQAVVVGMILSTFSFLLHGLQSYRQARWDLIRKLLLISIPGLVLGVFFSGSLNSVFIKGIVGVVLIIYVIGQWLQLHRKRLIQVREGDLSYERESVQEKLIQNNSWQFYMAGFLSGILNGLAAIPGPPIVAVLVKYLNKDTFQATSVHFFILQYMMSLGTRLIIQENILNLSLIVLMLGMALPIILGHWVGQPIRQRINEENFKKLVFTLLLVIGVTSAWEPFKTFFP